MKCRSCHAEIADKAIVCYRCGTPTADLQPVPRTPTPRGVDWPPIVVLIVVLALAAWTIPMTTPGTIARIGAWIVALTVLLIVVQWQRRRRAR
jgi:hypothetical protein